MSGLAARLRSTFATTRGRLMLAVGVGLAIAAALFLRKRIAGGSEPAAAVPALPGVLAPGAVSDIPYGSVPNYTAAAIPEGGFDFAPNLASLESEIDYTITSLSTSLFGKTQTFADQMAAQQDAFAARLEETKRLNEEQVAKLHDQMLSAVAGVQVTAVSTGSTGPAPAPIKKVAEGIYRESNGTYMWQRSDGTLIGYNADAETRKAVQLAADKARKVGHSVTWAWRGKNHFVFPIGSVRPR